MYKEVNMDNASLTAATWVWLLVPMSLVVLLSLVNFVVQRRGKK